MVSKSISYDIKNVGEWTGRIVFYLVKHLFRTTIDEAELELKKEKPNYSETRIYSLFEDSYGANITTIKTSDKLDLDTGKKLLHFYTSHDGNYTRYEYNIARPLEIDGEGHITRIEMETLSKDGDYEKLLAEKKGPTWEICQTHRYTESYSRKGIRSVLKKIDTELKIGLEDYFDKAMKDLVSNS